MLGICEMSYFSRKEPSKLEFIDPTRCLISTGVSIGELNLLAEDTSVKTIQFVKPLKIDDFKNIEHVIFSKRQDIELRAYGHYSSICDLSFLRYVPSVRRFSADALMAASNIEFISELEFLDELWVDVYDLLSFDFLDHLPTTLKLLGLGRTSSKSPSVSSVSRFNKLTYLYLDGQQKGIESVRYLSNLERIVLRSISTLNVDYLAGLERLWSVDVKLGGIKGFNALASLPNLNYLELWMVRGLSDLSFVSELRSLQKLFLQALVKVAALPDLSRSHHLRRIFLENMKGLSDLSSLEFAPALTEFCYVMAQNQTVEDLLPVLRNPNVKTVLCGFGSDKKNQKFVELARSYGKGEYKSSEFHYI